MKKYNVIDLYVIEKKKNKFICERYYENEYIEVLTKEKIKVNNEKVERLIEYYSILERICLDSKKPLLLTKKDVLLKYLQINNKQKEEKTDKKEMNVMIGMWQDYVESVKDDMPDIPIISAKELNKQKTLDKK